MTKSIPGYTKCFMSNSQGPGTVGRNLRRIRAARKLSTYKLAKAAGVSRQTISGIELGYDAQTDTKLSTLTQLANALGCEVRDLLETPSDAGGEG